MTQLNSKQRAALRARAHALNPVVQIGHAGLTEALLRQVDEALTAHELIKLKLAKECPITLEEATASLSSATRASAVQQIGRVMVLFRRNLKQPKITLKTGEAKKKAEAAAATVSKAGRQLNRNRTTKKRRRARVVKKTTGRRKPGVQKRPSGTPG